MSEVAVLPTLILLLLMATGVYAVAFCVSVLGNRLQPDKYLIASVLCLIGAFILLMFT